MTAAVKEWLLSMVAAALLLAVAEGMMPEGAPKRVGRLIGGVLLLLTMLRPVYTLDPVSLATWWQGETTAQWDSGLEETNLQLLEELISDSCRTYIQDTGQELGITCQAEVSCALNEEGTPVPTSVIISGQWEESARQVLEHTIASELGIPSEAQSYQKEEP